LPSGGDSAPLLVGDMVVVTTEPDQVLAFDAATGKERWKATCDVFSTYGEPGAALKEAFLAAHAVNSDYRSYEKDPIVLAAKEKMKARRAEIRIGLPVERPAYAAPSPCSDGTNIIVKFTTGVVGCYDLKGTEIWKQRPGGATTYSSPIVLAGKLLLAFPGGRNTKGHLALDPATGKTIWSNPEIGEGSWGTVLAFRLGDRLLGVSGAGQAFDPGTGKVLTQTASFGQHTTIARWNDILVVPSGHVYTKRQEKTRAFRLVSAADGSVTATRIWETAEPGGNCPPSVCLDGLFLLSAGSLRCYKLDDGAETAEPKLPKDPMGAHRVLPGLSVAGNRCIRLGLQGNIAVIQVEGGAVRVIGTCDLPKDNYNGPPAFAGKRMYVHGHTQLICLGE